MYIICMQVTSQFISAGESNECRVYGTQHRQLQRKEALSLEETARELQCKQSKAKILL